MKKTITNNAAIVKQFLDSEDLKYIFYKDPELFWVFLPIKHEEKPLQIIVITDTEGIMYYGFSPTSADPHNEEMKNQISQLMCRINLKHESGCFVLDFDNGNIIFQNYTDCIDVSPTVEMVRRNIDRICNRFNFYYRDICDIISSTSVSEDSDENKAELSEEKTTEIRTTLFDHEE